MLTLPTYILRFKAAFPKDLSGLKDNSNLWWLKVATALDPRFKELRCLPRTERGEVWQKLSEMLKKREPAPQTEKKWSQSHQRRRWPSY